MNYTEMESKVREATNDDPWGPTGQQMQELAQATFSYEYFPEVMSMLWRRMLIDNHSNWRRTYKSLVVLNYLVKNGAERAVTSAREHIYDLKGLESYAYVDENGKDCGVNVRIRVKQLIEFIQNDDALRDERKKAKKNRDKYVGVASDGGASSLGGGMKFNSTFSDSIPSRYDDDVEISSSKSSTSDSAVKSETGKRGNINSNGSKVSTKNESLNSANGTGIKFDDNEDPSNATAGLDKPKHRNNHIDPKEDSLVAAKPAAEPLVNLFDDLVLGSSSTIIDKPEIVAATPPISTPTPTPKQADLFESADILATGNEEPVLVNKQPKDDVSDLKAIVKNIDIFSNKKSRPIKTNKSNIPDLTRNNPNPIASSAPKQSSSTKPAVASLATSIIDKPMEAAETTCPTQQVNVESQQPQQEASVKKPSNLEALLSLSESPESILDAINSPISVNPQVEIPSSSLLIADPISCGSCTSKPSKLPDSWSSLVTGTKFNLDFDNLMKPDSKKGNAPSLNQLAKTKPTSNNNNDLFN